MALKRTLGYVPLEIGQLNWIPVKGCEASDFHG